MAKMKDWNVGLNVVVSAPAVMKGDEVEAEVHDSLNKGTPLHRKLVVHETELGVVSQTNGEPMPG